MKRYIIIILTIVLLCLFADVAYYRLGWYVDLHPDAEVRAVTKTGENTICILDGNGAWTPLEIRGVTVTAAEPGEVTSNFTTTKKTYLAWFSQIDALGANTLHAPYIMSEAFYRAFYEYNQTHDEPLYLVQGIALDDYVMDSTYDVFDERFVEDFRVSCIAAVDIIHGTRKLFRNEIPSAGHGSFTNDVSPWVIGYVLGSAWEPETVVYANRTYANDERYKSYQGKYLVTDEDATPVEAMLAYIGDSMIEYEAKRYKTQRVFGFYSNPDTDPLEMGLSSADSMDLILKAPINTENILATDAMLSGQFAAYELYPYSTDRLILADDAAWQKLGVCRADYAIEDGKYNYYAAYLQCLQNHHTMPVLIVGFGASSSRAAAKFEWDTERHFGGMTEREQGEAIVASWSDIMSTNCVGGILAAWQTDWGRTSASRGEIDTEAAIYWANAQEAAQGLGLLDFVPNAACTLDGNIGEWSQSDLVSKGENGAKIYVKYDEKYVYFMIEKPDFDFSNETLYIPIDTTQLSGSNYCSEWDVKFDRAADFLLIVNGYQNTRLLVQERYDFYRSGNIHAYYEQNIPDRDSALFYACYLPINVKSEDGENVLYETGRLTYGSIDPTSADYNTLADFMVGMNCIEIRLPWQLLHFSNPSEMEIYGDYYEDYSVSAIAIKHLYVGIGDDTTSNRIAMGAFRLRGWLGNVTYHERLKDSYYILQECWKDRD